VYPRCGELGQKLVYRWGSLYHLEATHWGYLLAMKGNQPGLAEDMQQLYLDAIDNDFAGLKHEECETTEKAHGRITTRNVHVVEIPQDHPQRRRWKNLRTLAVVMRYLSTANGNVAKNGPSGNVCATAKWERQQHEKRHRRGRLARRPSRCLGRRDGDKSGAKRRRSPIG
jgi:hypothetical protein